MIEELGVRLRAAGVVETTSGVNLTGNALENLGKKADVASTQIARTGKSTKETAAAMRLLPAQITDVVTSLASGQAAWLVAIQQGGQIKDSFGGFGPTMRLAAAAINPVTLALGAAAVASTALIAAYVSANREQTAFLSAITFTGNAAGVTTSDLRDMAQAIDQVRGTESQAADALAQFTATGQVGRQEMQRFAEQAIRMEQVTGKSVEETVKQFADLARAPLSASVRLNESYNHLTVSTYKQIKAFMEAGRVTEAGRVAMLAFADANDQRLPVMEQNIDNISWAWKGVKSAVLEAIDATVGYFRADSLGQQLKKTEADLAAFNARKVNIPALDDPRRAAMVERIASLKKQIEAEQQLATRQAANAAATKAAIADDQKKVKAVRQVQDASASLSDQIARRNSVAQAELANEGKLTEAERFRVDMLREIDEVQKKIGASRAADLRLQVEATARNIAAVEAQRNAAKDQEDLQRSFVADRQQATQAAERDVAQTLKANESLAAETAALGLSSDALYQRRLALNDSEIAEREAHLARIEGLPAYTEEATALQQQIELLRERRALLGQNYVKTQQVEEAKANQERTDAIAGSIEQGVIDGFRDGRKASEIFLREIQAQFLRTALRMPIQLLAQSGADLMGLALKGLSGLLAGGGGTSYSGWGIPAPVGASAVGMGLHGGGMGNEPTFTRSLPAATWAGAPRFHSGIGPDELPAVIKKTEGVFTEGQMKAMAPVSALAGAGARSVTFAPQIHIDSRTDRAEIAGLLNRAMRAAQADLLDKMNRRQV